MANRKRHFSTWGDAESAWDRESKAASVLSMALTDVLRGEVEWIEKKGKKIGLSRLAAPHGGIVVLVDRFVGARYLDDWLYEMERVPVPPLSDREGAEAWAVVRELVFAARRRQKEVQDAAFGKAVTP